MKLVKIIATTLASTMLSSPAYSSKPPQNNSDYNSIPIQRQIQQVQQTQKPYQQNQHQQKPASKKAQGQQQEPEASFLDYILAAYEGTIQGIYEGVKENKEKFILFGHYMYLLSTISPKDIEDYLKQERQRQEELKQKKYSAPKKPCCKAK